MIWSIMWNERAIWYWSSLMRWRVARRRVERSTIDLRDLIDAQAALPKDQHEFE
jgi:hypothetical protein